MNSSITNNDILNPKRRPSKRLAPLTGKKTDEPSAEIPHLLNCIKNICHQPCDTFDEIFKFSNKNSTLGKLYQLFLSLRDNKDYLLNQNIFNDLIIKKTEGLITKLNRTNPMNFIQFVEQIQIIAKENHLTKEYIYQKVSFVNIKLLLNYIISQLLHRTRSLE